MTITCCCCWWRCNLPSSTSCGWIPDKLIIQARRVRSKSLFGQRINLLDSMLLFLIVECADSSLCLAFWCGTICLIRCRFVLNILPACSEYSFRFSLPCLSSLRFGWNGKITLCFVLTSLRLRGVYTVQLRKFFSLAIFALHFYFLSAIFVSMRVILSLGAMNWTSLSLLGISTLVENERMRMRVNTYGCLSFDLFEL